MSLLQATLKIDLWNAWIFMSVFLLQMLAILLIDRRVSKRSHIPKEARQNKFERSVGIIGNLIWLLAMAYSVFLPLRLGTFWFYIGLSAFMVGLAIMVIATKDFMTAPADQLITKGAYAYSRHPMYLATFLICLGAGIATVSYPFLFLSLIMASCFYQEALIEERYCINKYGIAYEKYMNNTHRWASVRRKHGD